jgi:glutamine synthetase
MKIFLEYIWLDGYKPANLRSKTKVVDINHKFSLESENGTGDLKDITLEDLDMWSFDGSSTKQAEGTDSDCLLKPVFMCDDPFRGKPHKLVLCEVLNADGSPHKTNTRKALEEKFQNESKRRKEDLPWFGWEQEYTLTSTKHDHLHEYGDYEGLPLGFMGGPKGDPREQGEYYCGVGHRNVIGRRVSEEHLLKCVEVGLDVSGINAEVMLGQWEYQIGPVTALNGSDQLWISRYILNRVAEEHEVNVSYHPKPMTGDWNGSGCHVNFSTPEMRQEGGQKYIEEMCENMGDLRNEHIAEYGEDNEQRLTGNHETSNINEYSWGYSDRGRSIRIPVSVRLEGKGYLEDRRPASNCDPYRVSRRMVETAYLTTEITVS